MAGPDAAPPDRRGAPRPLILHFAAAAVSYEQAIALAPLATDPRFPWTDIYAEPGRAAGARLAGAGPAGVPTLALAALRRLREMIEGVEAYQRHPYRRALDEPPTIWRRGGTRLLDYGPPDGRPVLVIPSLVNRAYVLDLDGDASFLRKLSQAGLRPLLLDWGDPTREELGFGLEAYMTRRVLPAFDAVAATEPPAVIGYCMGGALAAALAARRPTARRLCLVGAPWDFSQRNAVRKALAMLGMGPNRARIEEALAACGAVFGALPVDALQALFAALDPNLALRKFRQFARLAPDSQVARRFVAVEDWLNDGVALAIPAARELLIDWHIDNDTGEGRWRVGGAPVRPEEIRTPTLALCARADRIAPAACAEALPRAIPGARIERPSCGHVGLVIGGAARQSVWRPVTEFLTGAG